MDVFYINEMSWMKPVRIYSIKNGSDSLIDPEMLWWQIQQHFFDGEIYKYLAIKQAKRIFKCKDVIKIGHVEITRCDIVYATAIKNYYNLLT